MLSISFNNTLSGVFKKKIPKGAPPKKRLGEEQPLLLVSRIHQITGHSENTLSKK